MPVLPLEDLDCIRLWRAVLLQAFRDLLAAPREESTQADQIECLWQRKLARMWLTNRSPALDDVCAMAGLEPANIHRAASLLNRALKRGDHREVARIRRFVFAALTMDPSHPEEPIAFDLSE